MLAPRRVRGKLLVLARTRAPVIPQSWVQPKSRTAPLAWGAGLSYATMKRARLDFGENRELGSKENPSRKVSLIQAQIRPPHRLGSGSRIALQCTAASASPYGVAGPLLYREYAMRPFRPPHTATRRRREARQGEVYCMRRKALTSPQFENGDGIRCRGRCRRRRRITCTTPVTGQIAVELPTSPATQAEWHFEHFDYCVCFEHVLEYSYHETGGKIHDRTDFREL